MFEDNDPFYTSLCSSKTLQSSKQGFFRDYVSHVAETGGPELLRKFGKLSTDEERIQFCFALPETHVLEPRTFFQAKSAELSKKRRVEGNNAMQRGREKQALLLYSQSVLKAPPQGVDQSVDEGRSLAYALANRSAALFQLNELDLCLQDIQASLREGYPDSLKYKLYERMGQCYKLQAQHPRAKVALQLALRMLEKSSVDEKKKDELSLGIQDEISRCDLTVNHGGHKQDGAMTVESSLPHVTGGPSALLPTASRAVCVSHLSEVGRFAVAKEPISTGDTLVVEPPYAACLLPDKFGTHCHHCFKRLKAPMACPRCSGVVFCSIKCRDSACSSYHNTECQFMDLFIGSGMSILCHVALRMITQSGLDHFLELRPSLAADAAEVLLDEKKGAYDSCDYKSVYNLVTLAERRPVQDFLDRTLMAVFLLKCLQKAQFFRQVSKEKGVLNEEELFIGSLLLRHLQLLQFNAHEVHEFKLTKPRHFRGSKNDYLGVAIYPTVSFFNHDCYPAVTRHFIGTNIVIKALRPIQPGEVIAENYGPIFTHKTKTERQRSLQSRYWFKCSCQACQEDWPMYKTLTNDTLRLKCTNCGKLLSYNSTKKNSSSLKCLGCKQHLKLLPVMQKIQDCEKKYESGLSLMDEGKVEEAIESFCFYLDTMHMYAHPPYRDIHLCQEALRLCMANEGNVYITEQDKTDSS